MNQDQQKLFVLTVIQKNDYSSFVPKTGHEAIKHIFTSKIFSKNASLLKKN